MKHSTGKPTKAEAARMARLKEMPCIACSQANLWAVEINQPLPTEIHHLLSGNKRRGHLFTIPLCGWHHRASTGLQSFMGPFVEQYGPSLAHGSKDFRHYFGTDDELLERTNKQLEKHDARRT